MIDGLILFNFSIGSIFYFFYQISLFDHIDLFDKSVSCFRLKIDWKFLGLSTSSVGSATADILDLLINKIIYFIFESDNV